MLPTLWVCKYSGKSARYQNHISALKGGTLGLKYSFSSVTGTASTAVSEHQKYSYYILQKQNKIRKTGKKINYVLEESRQWCVYCQQIQGENLRNRKGRQCCLTFLIVQTLWNRKRMICLPVVIVLHLILQIPIKSGDEELSTGGNSKIAKRI